MADAPGPLIGKGRAADVYDLGDGRVLRRNRNGASTELEATVMRHLHLHGYPVPEVHDADGGDLVMERLDGPTMLDAFARQPWKLNRWARVLADLHTQLEQVPMDGLDLRAKAGAAEVLLHGDLHPDNVMLTARGPVVIDWPNAGFGPRGFDVAYTWVIMATSETDSGRIAGSIQSAARSQFVRRFLAGTDRELARTHLPVAAKIRQTDPNLRPAEADSIQKFLARQLS
jgi:aminoglycoside phosphotransferase (APT) family kinase protein